ncbi:MAG: hypothetical protein VX223_02235, partial [Myxococcota bacterium]|nr:hypothetical protein [Myxococcota bacterium]
GLETAIHKGALPGRTKATGWTVEVRIPFSGLADIGGSAPEPNSEWKANFFRIEQPADMAHLASWSPVSDSPRADFHNLKRAGVLQFVQTPQAIKNRVLRPTKPTRQAPAGSPGNTPGKAEQPKSPAPVTSATTKPASPAGQPSAGTSAINVPTSPTKTP